MAPLQDSILPSVGQVPHGELNFFTIYLFELLRGKYLLVILFLRP